MPVQPQAEPQTEPQRTDSAAPTVLAPTGHVVLLGDSIFDNKAYVGAGPAVIDQVPKELPNGWKATLLAVDGSITLDINQQLQKLPADATHLVVSMGSNDALEESTILDDPARSVAEVLLKLHDIRDRFYHRYQSMIEAVLAKKLPTAISTIYDSNYTGDQLRIIIPALCVFNDIILRTAVEYGLPVLDLRTIFTQPADYANPIEPSSQGGQKIAFTIAKLVTAPVFGGQNATLFGRYAPAMLP